MKEFLKAVVEHGVFFLQFLGTGVMMFGLAKISERFLFKRNQQVALGSMGDVKRLTAIGLFSAISFIIMLFEFPLPFAPAFYKMDLSEVPVLIVSFSFGPVAGVLTEFVKIMLKLLFRSTTTAFVGELANFMVGCALILPASILYHTQKSKKSAMIGCVLGILVMSVFAVFLNAVYLVPTFAKMFGMPMDALIQMGAAMNPAIVNLHSFVLLTVLPFNLLKGSIVCIIVVLLYKSLRTLW